MVGRPARGSCSFSALQGPRETSPPRLGGRDATRLAQAPLRGGRGVLWSLNRTREGIWRAPSPRGKGCGRGSPQKLRERCPQTRAGTPWRHRMGGPRVVGVEGGWGPRETRKWTASPRTAKGAAKLWPPVCPVWLGLLHGPRRRQRLSPAPWTRPPCPAGQPRGCGSPPRPAPGHGAARTCPRAGRLPPPSPGPKQPGGVRPTERSCRDWHPETTGPLNPGDDGRAPTMAECPARTVTRHTGGSGSGLQAPLPVRRKCPDS